LKEVLDELSSEFGDRSSERFHFELRSPNSELLKSLVLPMPLLDISGLRASAGDREILRGIDLAVMPGEVHAVMGPNGSGKSTLAQVLAGNPAYEVTAGEVIYNGENLLELEPEERAQRGLFLAFQYPVEIPGVSNAYFLRAAYNEIRKARGEEEVDPLEFAEIMDDRLEMMGMDASLLNRSVNTGFSGGEKKRNEILQMAVLQPRLGILDETDSGLDIDALRTVADGVNRLRSDDRSFVVVTHYQRLLNYIIPDRVHVLAGGRIMRSGGKELALELEERGYEGLLEEATA
jgi:Fe-S cluster assembly ATP-binding protein